MGIMEYNILKVDEEKRIAFGWAYVSHNSDGSLVIDKQDDVIDDPAELESAAYNFTLQYRDAGDMHVRKSGVGDLVESVVFTPEKIEKMGLQDSGIPTGWWLGFYVEDEDVWSKVKKGEYTGFSIGGSGKRHPLEKHGGGSHDDKDHGNWANGGSRPINPPWDRDKPRSKKTVVSSFSEKSRHDPAGDDFRTWSRDKSWTRSGNWSVGSVVRNTNDKHAVFRVIDGARSYNGAFPAQRINPYTGKDWEPGGGGVSFIRGWESNWEVLKSTTELQKRRQELRKALNA